MNEELSKSFAVLGLHSGATRQAAREAYRDLVKVWHPDRFANDPKLAKKTEETLKEINRAFERLESYFNAATHQQPLSNRPAANASDPELPPTTRIQTILIGAIVIAVVIWFFATLPPEFYDSGSAKPKGTEPLNPISNSTTTSTIQ